MREYGRNRNRIKGDITKAKNNEIVYDEVEGDILIKKEDGNNYSMYKDFVERSIDQELIDNKRVIYGISINLNEPDPDLAVTYIEDSTDFMPIRFNEDGSPNYGNWDLHQLHRIFGMNPTSVYGNRMVQYRKTWYKFVFTDENLKFYVSNYRPDSTFTACTPNDWFYVSPYPATEENGKLVIKDYSSACINTKDYFESIMDNKFRALEYRKNCYLTGLTWLLLKSMNVYKYLDLQPTDDMGYLVSTTNDVFYSKNDHGTIWMGLENPWSYEIYATGYSTKGRDMYSEDGTLLFNNIFPDGLGFISRVEVCDDNILYPSEYEGSSVTYYCAEVIGYENDNIMKPMIVGDLSLDLYPAFDEYATLLVYDEEFIRIEEE